MTTTYSATCCFHNREMVEALKRGEDVMMELCHDDACELPKYTIGNLTRNQCVQVYMKHASIFVESRQKVTVRRENGSLDGMSSKDLMTLRDDITATLDERLLCSE